MFSRIARSGLWTTTPSALRYVRPSIFDRSRPSATSLMVKSNSLRATKSISGDPAMLPFGSTATLAPTRPAFRFGFTAFSASIILTSEAKDGVEVCRTARS